MLTLKEHLDYQNLRTCPICKKQYDAHWKVFAHIKKSKEDIHVLFFNQQELECIKTYENSQRKYFHKELFLKNNIFSGISFNKISKTLKKKYSNEDLENFRRKRISSTLKDVPKSKNHNKKVSKSIKRAWDEGKFNTEEYKKAHQKGIENRPSLAGKNNPMYGKPSPKGSGRGKGGTREDIGHYVRSSWEANICRVSNLIERKYEYEPNSFKITINNLDYTYTPDFYFPDKDIYYEVKGHAKSRKDWVCSCKNCQKGKVAISQVKSKYNIKLFLIGHAEYNIIKNRFKERVKNWEDYK